jgi:predicted nucleotidyltransferase
MTPEATIDDPGHIRTLSPCWMAETFYSNVLRELLDGGIPFLVAGSYAVSAYVGVNRATKDLDLFTTPGEFPRLLSFLKERGYTIAIEDDRWIGKIHSNENFVDVIFGSANGMMPVQEDWFQQARQMEVLGICVPMLSPTDLIWSKALIKDRQRYDGADIANLILRQSKAIDWKRLLAHMDAHWEVLLGILLNFRWIFPSERVRVPRWLIEELIDRLKQQLDLPQPQRKVCRGRLFSRCDYKHAIDEWGYADIGGEENQCDG